MSECIFCMIGAGEVPATVVWENDDLVAFDDSAPQAPVHTLIIPRKHYASLTDTPEDVVCALMAAIPGVAERKGVTSSGYRTIINTGDDAGQTVHHVHVHLLGGRRMAEGMITFTEGK